MMLDAPSYSTGEEEDAIVLTEKNAGDIMNYVNSML
jgi:hypothetical protein